MIASESAPVWASKIEDPLRGELIFGGVSTISPPTVPSQWKGAEADI